MLKSIHHAAIICSDYQASKHFYVNILGLKIIAENHRAKRPSTPEVQGLRHLAFAVDSVEQVKTQLEAKKIAVENIRTDEFTGKKFTFFADPDGLPLEIYQA